MDKIENNSRIPKVSVIMPVFNTEKYVAEAIESIINQTLSDIEIIVINDKSTDNSLRIVTEYALSDNRIEIYSKKKNEGPSESRNLGLKQAKGKYIYFMDSDDLLEKDALETCYIRSEKDALDFVFFDATAFKEDKSESLNDYYLRNDILNENKLYTGEEVLNILMNKKLYRSAVWMCFINREYIKNKELDFYPGIIHEDELFAAKLHMNAQRIGYISKPFFRRRIRPNSITSKQFSLYNISCYIIVVEKLIEYAKEKKDINKSLSDKVCAYILNPAIYRAVNFSFENRMKVIKLCLDSRFSKYVSFKNKIIVMFPWTIKLKSIAK